MNRRRPMDVLDTTGSHGGLPIVERRARPREPGEEKRWHIIFGKRLWSLISTSDTAPTQFFLAMCSGMVAATLLFDGDSLSRPAYHFMAGAVGAYADEKWASLFVLFAVLEMFNTITFGHPRFSLAVNLFGAALFMAIPIAIYWEPVQPPPLIGPLSAAVALAAGWVAVLTNNKPARGWRGD